jgi:hypothetical protein
MEVVARHGKVTALYCSLKVCCTGTGS